MSTDIRTILTAEELATLQAGYSRAVMDTVATQAVAGPYPPVQGLVAFAADRFYPAGKSATVLAPADREKVLIGIFAAGRRPAFALAVHVYWALAEGVSIDEIGEIVTLSALYGGLDVQTDAMRTITVALVLLKAQAAAASTDPKAAASLTILPLLLAKFS